jgi:thiamine-phosphate pyrophosphorylase
VAVNPVSGGVHGLCFCGSVKSMDERGYTPMMLSGLYVITDEELCPGRTHAQIARAAVEGGARIIQIRDKSASDRKFYEDALEVRRITRGAGALFIVNDRVDIAAAVEADGVNLGQTDLPVAAARRILGKGVLIGTSADSPEQAAQAVKDGADHIGYGPVFATTTKLDAGPVSGLDTLRRVVQSTSVPVVAIGGISISNIARRARRSYPPSSAPRTWLAPRAT